MKYLPFLTGTYSTAPGLWPIARQTDFDKLIFQITDDYINYLQNKTDCRKENMGKYYCEERLLPSTSRAVNHYIAAQLQQEYPHYFEFSENGSYCTFINLQTRQVLRWHKESNELSGPGYLSVFDALCCQVQEDFAICQLQEDDDWMAAIHLCAPNHWGAEDKTGKNFNAVHAPVPGMEKTQAHHSKMLQSIVHKGPFTRFAWGIATDNRLNHHPQPPPGIDADWWQGRKIDAHAQLYIRTERQNLVGFPETNAFLFTIRTYFYPVALLENHEKRALWSAVRSMSPQSLLYKGLTEATGFLAEKLFDE
ncbi:heme-dependent oxidative N-demethylase family protein [Foetidibacter luteolus]|uniref:heme-dependent oxidative N-demethylase family protein n=1 Tax=Foetidibacter luteolus TaxID=2608880 RepID=UPI00129BC47E|nr:DUF3445 domain-containing protein [Foetidibacter luteolus]